METSFLWMKISKLYRTSTKHIQSYSSYIIWISFLYSLKYIQNSSDNNFAKNAIFGPLLTLGKKIQNLIPFLQDMSNQILEKKLT